MVAKKRARQKNFGRAHEETVMDSADRANVRFILPDDTALWVAPAHRSVIRQRLEWTRQNFGLMQEMIAGIARQTVGKGLILQLNSKSPKWDAKAEAQFEDWALTPSRCDASGRRNFYEAQNFAIQQFIGPGEFFCRDVANPTWDNEPCFQIYDPSEIVSPEEQADDIYDGIRCNDRHVPTEIFYKEGETVLPSPASEWVHWYDAKTANQVRGTSPFAPALNRLVGMYELERLTIRSAKAHQLIALVLKGFNKSQQKGAFGSIGTAGGNLDPAQDAAAAERLFQGAGGAIAYVGENGGAQLLSSTQPSPLISQFFTDHLLRDICICTGFPMEWWWKMDTLGGPGQRAILAKVDAIVQVLADALIYRWVKRQVVRVISDRINRGMLAKPRDQRWMENMSFQCPPRISIDNGRDTNATLARLSNGVDTMRDIADASGRNYRSQMRQWLREPLEFIQMARDMKYTPAMLARLEANMPLWRAAMPGAAAAPETPEQEDETTTTGATDQKEEIESMKAAISAIQRQLKAA